MFDSHAGYAVASKIDKLINEALQTYEITDDRNSGGYETLIRTIRTSIDIMQKTLKGGRYNAREKAAYNAGVQAGRDEMQIMGTS